MVLRGVHLSLFMSYHMRKKARSEYWIGSYNTWIYVLDPPPTPCIILDKSLSPSGPQVLYWIHLGWLKKESFLSVFSTLNPSALKQELSLCAHTWFCWDFFIILSNPSTAAFQPVPLQSREDTKAKAALLLWIPFSVLSSVPPLTSQWTGFYS